MDILNHDFLQFIECAEKNNLRYLLIDGYAVNYYGYNRHTADMDIWLAPTLENRAAFIHTLSCMNYSTAETAPLKEEDFTLPFVGSIGARDNLFDVLTFVHKNISFDAAEKERVSFEIQPGVHLFIVPYKTLLEMKLLTHREKDMFEVARLEEIHNSKNQ